MWTSAILALASVALARPHAERQGDGTTAAEKFGWTDLAQEDTFDGTELSDLWGVYDGPGHDGNGIRSPDAIMVADGMLTIDGTPDGTTGGLTWANGQLYGR